MALAVVQRPLSGSTQGMPIQVSATGGGTNTTIHAVVSGTNIYDQVFAWATNSSTLTVSVVVEWGDSANEIRDEIPARTGYYPLIDGLFLFGVTATGDSATIKIFASTSQVIDIHGHVNRITET